MEELTEAQRKIMLKSSGDTISPKCNNEVVHEMDVIHGALHNVRTTWNKHHYFDISTIEQTDRDDPHLGRDQLPKQPTSTLNPRNNTYRKGSSKYNNNNNR
ncbi:uncharacterized protein LOC129776418 isoform X4 [Toxorhynchites rutilus septentrionalis]|uniref:uncharacterized protein LOC129776418 isoform X4 n=1 Tax=Toxorhynchites rutilus septentrionalis TaxID=329112 RepID=UPI00247AD451|nr:uncharacterized protein LOC129776418 isoform X4 [Toxorhynchites rutilus septentrionalis]